MVKEKYEVYHKAFKEFMEIVKFFPRNEYKKIPKSFIHFIEENMDDSYESIYDYMAELVELNQLESYEIDHLQEGDYLTVSYYK